MVKDISNEIWNLVREDLGAGYFQTSPEYREQLNKDKAVELFQKAIVKGDRDRAKQLLDTDGVVFAPVLKKQFIVRLAISSGMVDVLNTDHPRLALFKQAYDSHTCKWPTPLSCLYDDIDEQVTSDIVFERLINGMIKYAKEKVAANPMALLSEKKLMEMAKTSGCKKEIEEFIGFDFTQETVQELKYLAKESGITVGEGRSR